MPDVGFVSVSQRVCTHYLLGFVRVWGTTTPMDEEGTTTPFSEWVRFAGYDRIRVQSDRGGPFSSPTEGPSIGGLRAFCVEHRGPAPWGKPPLPMPTPHTSCAPALPLVMPAPCTPCSPLCFPCLLLCFHNGPPIPEFYTKVCQNARSLHHGCVNVHNCRSQHGGRSILPHCVKMR